MPSSQSNPELAKHEPSVKRLCQDLNTRGLDVCSERDEENTDLQLRYVKRKVPGVQQAKVHLAESCENNAELPKSSIAFLLNPSTDTKNVPLLYSTSSSGLSKGSSLGSKPPEISADLESKTRSLMPFRAHQSAPTGVTGVNSAFDPSGNKLLEGAFVAEQLHRKGWLIQPSRTPGFWLREPIRVLFQETPYDFFHRHSQIAGVSASVLSFSLPDVTFQKLAPWAISRDDSDAFYTLKRAIWDWFCLCLIRSPGTEVFRVEVVAHTGYGLRKVGALSKLPADKRSKPPRSLLSKSAPTGEIKSAHLTSSTFQQSITMNSSSCLKRVIHGEYKPIPRGVVVPLPQMKPLQKF